MALMRLTTKSGQRCSDGDKGAVRRLCALDVAITEGVISSCNRCVSLFNEA